MQSERRCRKGSGGFLRVPKLCPGNAFVPILAYLAQCRISNLRCINTGLKNDPPSRHHSEYLKNQQIVMGTGKVRRFCTQNVPEVSSSSCMFLTICPCGDSSPT